MPGRQCGTDRRRELAQGGFCSLLDPSCPSGRRFIVLAGGPSNRCVDEVAPPSDAAIDAPVLAIMRIRARAQRE